MKNFELGGGIVVQSLSLDELLQEVESAWKSSRPYHICTVNPEIVVRAEQNQAFKAAVVASDLRTIDGIGVILAVMRRYIRKAERLTGVTIMAAVLDLARRQGGEVMIVGAEAVSRERAEARMRAEGVKVCPGVSPRVNEAGEADTNLAKMLPKNGVVLVALGTPKQELWIRHTIDNNGSPNLYVGVGGAIDYYSGVAPKPPSILCALGLEWLYRLVRHPRTRIPRLRNFMPRFLWRYVVVGK